MRNLKEQGYRFLVSPDGKDSAWVHPAGVAELAGWTDCTDMDDHEFTAFMCVTLPAASAA